ncbi:uncharacterized protein LOC111280553 [Durio zibethinus]|uniref:Nucleolar protein 10 n=1 Tax=Durio zibethinus TaxID=66656 RepID=A0A6P5X7Z9_DURZI|nr:uncharacterized protein LOC111280553 [Durio zibethinus]
MVRLGSLIHIFLLFLGFSFNCLKFFFSLFYICYSFCLDKMYLQFYINENGDKVYTTKIEIVGRTTFYVMKLKPFINLKLKSWYPTVSSMALNYNSDNVGLETSRFSPDDKYSRQRVLLKKRFGLLPTQ